jgi:hypothetical protein
MFKLLRKSLLYIVLAPYLVIGLGMASNQLVLNANNDTFPVRLNPIKAFDWSNKGKLLRVIPPDMFPKYPKGAVFINDNLHVMMTPDTHLNWLADIFDFHNSVISIGDMLLDFGEWLNGFAFYLWAGALLRKLFAE